MMKYKLPELSYGYSALEPWISGKILELHHSRHHGGYVVAANEGLLKLRQVQNKVDFRHISEVELTLSFNISGHLLHSLFWKNLMPKGGGEPEGDLLLALKENFQSFETFRRQMIATADDVHGAGWAAMVWEPSDQRLLICQIHQHNRNLIPESKILMLIDVWEHAYYLQYQNRRNTYCDALWHLWNWQDISQRFELARRPYVSPKD